MYQSLEVIQNFYALVASEREGLTDYLHGLMQ